MKREEEIVNYAMSFQGKGIESEELKETIRLAIIDGAKWADKTMIEKAINWLEKNVWEYTGIDYAALSDSFIEAMQE